MILNSKYLCTMCNFIQYDACELGCNSNCSQLRSVSILYCPLSIHPPTNNHYARNHLIHQSVFNDHWVGIQLASKHAYSLHETDIAGIVHCLRLQRSYTQCITAMRNYMIRPILGIVAVADELKFKFILVMINESCSASHSHRMLYNLCVPDMKYILTVFEENLSSDYISLPLPYLFRVRCHYHHH